MMRYKISLLLSVAFIVAFPARSSYACFCVNCDCATAESLHTTTIDTLNTLVEEGFEFLIDDWINDYLFENYWKPALSAFSKQITISSQKTFLELQSSMTTAKQQEASQKLIQQKKYESTVSLQPDEGTCTAITLTQSVLASDAKSKANHAIMQQKAASRSMGNMGESSSRGPDADRLARFEFASSRYFTTTEMGGALENYATGTDDTRFGADISPHTLLEKGTIEIDLSSPTVTSDEEDIYALRTNLYDHKTLTRLSKADLTEYGSLDELDDIQGLAALQAISQYSFDSIVSLKSQGDPSSAAAIEEVLASLGMGPNAIDNLLSQTRAPSYLQQLEILSKTIQTTPEKQIKDFIHVDEGIRRLAIREAIELMVKFEIYRSYQRSTVMAATLHELKRRKLQDEWETQPVFFARGER